MKWAFLLGSPAIGGGTNVIFEHAVYALRNGVDVTVITWNKVEKKDIAWHKSAEELKFKTYEEVQDDFYDVCIITWWKTAYEAYRVTAKTYIYFVQSIESNFYPEEEKPLRMLVEATYKLPFDVITEATWIKNYLRDNHDLDAYLVRNGIRKDMYSVEGDCIASREEGKLRVLVEGPVDVDFKNVPKTVKLCQKSDADEIWLLTTSKISYFEGVNRVFSNVPMNETQRIYRSCDVIIKLSYVEGMFGPPLEMFHCGGTSITYDVTGYDEYIINGYNGLVAKTDDDEMVIKHINLLKNDSNVLRQLKSGAIQTANSWCSWDESSNLFYNSVCEIIKKDKNVSQKRIEHESKFFFDNYVIAENYRKELNSKVVSKIKTKIVLFLKKIIPAKIRQAIRKIVFGFY